MKKSLWILAVLVSIVTSSEAPAGESAASRRARHLKKSCGDLLGAPSVKYSLIDELRERHPVRRLCALLGVSASGYYAWCSRPESDRAREDRRLGVAIRAAFKSSRESYGARRLRDELKAQGIDCGRHRVSRLMRESNLIPKKARQFRVTTQSKHRRPVAENLLGQNFEAARPDQVWIADITYIRTLEGWLYLAVVMDLWSRRVIGWSLRPWLDDRLTLEALQRALEERSPPELHHSDRGSQYGSAAYRELLEQHGVMQSMSRKGNCYDNAVVESFFDSLKTEEVLDRVYRSRASALASHSGVATGRAQLTQHDQSGVNGVIITFVDDGTTLTTAGTATGLTPGDLCVSLIYDNRSVPGGPEACEPAIFDPTDPDFILPTMFVGLWTINPDGSGNLAATNTNPNPFPVGPGDDYVPLSKIKTISIRCASVDFEVVACGEEATHPAN